jgi:hypothetical protein
MAPLAPVTPTVMMDALVEGMIFRGYFSLAAASRQVKPRW